MPNSSNLAIVASACRFPDATSPSELWSNVVEGRRSFRAMPRERIDLMRYASELVGEADSITPVRAGLLTNWRVDRSALRIPQATFAATDLTHWLALELALEAMETIGGTAVIDRQQTAVIVANTLTGEFSRAALLRMRQPFLDDTLMRACNGMELSPETGLQLRNRFAAELRRHFPDPNEDSLAGGLANTIAGRIANHFDFRGGAYSVDGACASSLVAVADAANLLVSRQVDSVVVTAVDLSLDPFELVGFSRNGALARGEMRVFDARAEGFWPGEGGACILLMREDDAVRKGLKVEARIRGWGMSTDGAGGLTRPSHDGQVTACRRACALAQVDPAELTFVEAHGTGTAVGDPIEIRALATLREKARSPLPLGSIKANIGHTKAAAGLAGLLKTVEALKHGVIPPHVSCETPHPVFSEVDHRVYPVARPVYGNETGAIFAGVSSFGFGGINAHVVLERAGGSSRAKHADCQLVPQDVELFLFSGDHADGLVETIAAFERRAPTLSMAELADAAAHAASTLTPGAIRIAVLASHGVELAARLAQARAAVSRGDTLRDPGGGVLVERPRKSPRLGFLFPGQGAPCRPDGGAWRRRFANLAALMAGLPAVGGSGSVGTELVQPAVIAASLAALEVLQSAGITASVATGHSLGEIASLAWAEALDPQAALELAALRGAIMARDATPNGSMLRVALAPDDAERLAQEVDAVVACRNGPAEAVLSGQPNAISLAVERCRSCGIDASRLAVSHAFHSRDMSPACDPLARALATIPFRPIRRNVISTVTGSRLSAQQDPRELLADQLVSPVLFDSALELVAAQSDILLEVGPGQGLTRLASNCGIAALSVDAFSDSLRPLLATIAALFTAGVDIQAVNLFSDRHTRSFDPGAVPRFIQSPCGSRDGPADVVEALVLASDPDTSITEPDPEGDDALAVVRSVIARETGLPLSGIDADDRFLDVLHLNSLAVTRIVVAAARALQAGLPAAPTEFANATPRKLAEALAELRTFHINGQLAEGRIAGVRPWVRTYAMRWAQTSQSLRGDNQVRWLRLAVDQQLPSSFKADDNCGLCIWIDQPLTGPAAELLIGLVARAAKAGIRHLALCHRGAPVSAFMRSVAQEGHFVSVRAIDCASTAHDGPQCAGALSCLVDRYMEVRLVGDGVIEQPTFLPIEPLTSRDAVIGSDDVVVVVGGGKGIAAECALRIARSGAAVIVVGRSRADDPDVAATLDRAARSGARCRYVRADVLDGRRLARALAPAIRQFGPATTLVFAPAINEPARLTDLDGETVRRTLAPKVTGLQQALGALGPQLRRLITFGSIIGRIGLEGEAHYALANAMQSAATEQWANECAGRCALAVEWTLWGGVGMGERLGTIERLGAQGVDAISVDDALDAFDRLIGEGATGVVAVTSRFGPPPHLSLGPTELPMFRFIDEPKIHFPGVELIVETELSRGRDPYLDDHIVDGHPLLPAVLGLEAMAQVASALTPGGTRTAIRDVGFDRPLYVPDATRIRIAALRVDAATTEVFLSAEDDGFSIPCMRATFGAPAPELTNPCDPGPGSRPKIPAGALYGPLFFNGGRFRRIHQFELATSRRILAQLTAAIETRWFGTYEPPDLMLWDPGATDAALHALQVTIPHRRVLPVSVGRIEIDATAGPAAFVSAIERAVQGNLYHFDLAVTDAEGRVAQRWTNAVFRAVDSTVIGDVLAAAPMLAACYLERVARDSLGDDTIAVSLACEPNGTRQSRRDAVLGQLGLDGLIDRRADGRPVRVDGGGSVSVAYGHQLAIAVTARDLVGCDIELVPGDEEARSGSIRRHTVLEACRKVGRMPSVSALQSFSARTSFRIDDVRVVRVDLPLAAGRHSVAFCRLMRAAPIVIQDHQIAATEVSL
jgi:enediyne polyketide synthase